MRRPVSRSSGESSAEDEDASDPKGRRESSSVCIGHQANTPRIRMAGAGSRQEAEPARRRSAPQGGKPPTIRRPGSKLSACPSFCKPKIVPDLLAAVQNPVDNQPPLLGRLRFYVFPTHS